MRHRIRKVRTELARRRLGAVVVTGGPAVRWLTGFSGSNGIAVVTRTEAWFLSDPRYATQSAGEVSGFRTSITAGSLLERAGELGVVKRGMKVGYDPATLSAENYFAARKAFRGAKLVNAAGMMDSLSVIKEADEAALISKAASITDRVFRELLSRIRPGVRERDIAAEISYLQRNRGADGDAFEPIVASGPNGALPHARAGGRKLRAGDLVVVDFGCTFRGYCSDLTRTLAVGKVSTEQRRHYDAVLEAQRSAIDGARPGVSGREVDAIARNVLQRHGLESYFIHALGHGVGLQIHERLRLSKVSSDVLRPGMVVTFEPGVYLPGRWGIRIEDDVLITSGRPRLLTRSPRDLIIL